MRAPFAPTAFARHRRRRRRRRALGRRSGQRGRRGTSAATALGTAASLPLAQSLALVALAAWGVLLVTRGAVRRVVAVLAAFAAAGVVLTLASARWVLVDDVAATLRDLGVPDAEVGLTAAYWLALVAAMVCLVASVLAVLAVPSWPEMGRRYDAPTASEEPGDLWRAMDEGRDPTSGPTP